MDQHEINVLMAIVAGLGSVLGGCATWWVNRVWNSMDSLQTQVTNISQGMQKQISELNLQIAQNYVPRHELEKNFERIAKAQEETNRMMYAGFEDMRKEIAHISRNQASTKTLTEAVASLRGRG